MLKIREKGNKGTVTFPCWFDSSEQVCRCSTGHTAGEALGNRNNVNAYFPQMA